MGLIRSSVDVKGCHLVGWLEPLEQREAPFGLLAAQMDDDQVAVEPVGVTFIA
jgi:hypothetical protein